VANSVAIRFLENCMMSFGKRQFNTDWEINRF